VGINVDPINNGLVAYVPIDKLMNATGITSPNLLVVNLADSADRNSAITQIRAMVKTADSDLEVFDLSQTVEQNEAFLGATWQGIMFLPLFTVASATLCMVGYMMLSIDEQRPEFAMLRAVGARPRLIINISAIQGAIVLFSSFGTGISLGIIITVMILMANPVVTAITVVVISGWLISALIVMFGLSLYPAFRLAKTAILRIAT
jgi:ABC-type antimicrobial peptide transport system permease subunit